MQTAALSLAGGAVCRPRVLKALFGVTRAIAYYWLRMIVFNCFRNLLVVPSVILLSACAELNYYAQSAGGQLDIVERREPIDVLLADESTDQKLRQRLAGVKQMRAFAVDKLGLPDTGSYTRYADLDRDYAVLALYAAPEFSTQLHTWCYPVVGCAAYRGYFDRGMLSAYVEELQRQQFDTYVANVPAYSTLGWFDDPVLNTVLDWPEPQLAGLIFHELSHQQLYVKGDTVFNESFATTVERVGVTRWLRAQADEAAIDRYQVYWRHRRQVVELIAVVRSDLDRLYGQELAAADKREMKRQRLEGARSEYRALRREWTEDPGYDAWFAGELNNAKLGAAQAYHAYVDAFTAILAEVDNDLGAFYARAAAIGRLDAARREQCLAAYLRQNASACRAMLSD